jgi:hypothetical protein
MQENVSRKVYIVCVFMLKNIQYSSSPEQQIMKAKYTSAIKDPENAISDDL